MIGHRLAWGALLAAALSACGGPTSRLVTVRSESGSGAVDFAVKNGTGVPINALYMAKTEQVNAAGQELDDDSPRGQALWGPDLLQHAAIGRGERVKLEISEPGTWDARVLDRDGRYQHITGLHLGAGGRYILELNDGGWRVK